jgi:hypothetical protein
MTALDHPTHARLQLLLAGALIHRRLGAAAPEFLAEYPNAFREARQWQGAGEDWSERLWLDASRTAALPLVRLAQAGAGRLGVELLAAAALATEDGRVAGVLGSEGHAAIASLVALWRVGGGKDHPEAVREALGFLLRCGMLAIANPAAAAHAREVAPTALAARLLTGCCEAEAGYRLFPLADLPALAEMILPEGLSDDLDHALAVLARVDRYRDTVVWLRGVPGNGRRTLAMAMARRVGAGGAVMVRAPASQSAATTESAPAPMSALTPPPSLTPAHLAAFLADAVLVVVADGSFAMPPPPERMSVRTVVITPPRSALDAGDRPVLSLDLPLPAPAERLALWRYAAPALPQADAAELAARFRAPSGVLMRAARCAVGLPSVASTRRALRDMSDGRLEALAQRIDTEGPYEFLALGDNARGELDALVLRCRHRELLVPHAGSGPGAVGVRALLSGPSGAGKTLTARWLARELGKDLWRIDLASAVSKYVGETEKTLERAFAAAEERDVVLLLDEGDALMARRTDVGSANDRYANLETNFLLQRLELFSGVLIVTTNAGERIDTAFARRMDAVIPFALPDEIARHAILTHHLGDHRVSNGLMEEVAVRCVLSGGQLRNIALHARLLALSSSRELGDGELRAAVEREYRKGGDGFCPLKPYLSRVLVGGAN